MTLFSRLVSALLLVAGIVTQAQERTIGLLLNDPRSSPGYTLFSPLGYTSTYLIDNDGMLIHEWKSSGRSGAVYLLESGNLIRMISGGAPGQARRIEIVDWNGNMVWRYEPPPQYEPHHDLKQLPNGNIIIIAWETKLLDEALNAGRDPGTTPGNRLMPDVILEIKQTGPQSGVIVWRWTFWDHLSCDRSGTWVANGLFVPTDVQDPGRFNVNNVPNLQTSDWIHCNGIDYNEERDEIAFSSLFTSEFYVISHATANYTDPPAGMAAAKGRAGDFLYRWGNPVMYGRGEKQDQRCFGLHDIQWIPKGFPGEGNFLLFNNGQQRNFSSIDELAAPLDSMGRYTLQNEQAFGPNQLEWTYTSNPKEIFYAPFVSGAQRLPNGNTLITDGIAGHLVEVMTDGTVVWWYKNPVDATGPKPQGTDISGNTLFKARRYPLHHTGFAGRDLTPKGPIELYQTSVLAPAQAGMTLALYPNPARSSVTVTFNDDSPSSAEIVIADMLGRIQRHFDRKTVQSAGRTFSFPVHDLPPGQYICRILGRDHVQSSVFLVVHD